MIEYRYGILSQLISEIDNYYQKTFAQFQKEALDLAKQNSSGDFEVYYTILQGFDSEDERISSLCKEVRKILFCSIFSYYEDMRLWFLEAWIYSRQWFLEVIFKEGKWLLSLGNARPTNLRMKSRHLIGRLHSASRGGYSV